MTLFVSSVSITKLNWVRIALSHLSTVSVPKDPTMSTVASVSVAAMISMVLPASTVNAKPETISIVWNVGANMSPALSCTDMSKVAVKG